MKTSKDRKDLVIQQQGYEIARLTNRVGQLEAIRLAQQEDLDASDAEHDRLLSAKDAQILELSEALARKNAEIARLEKEIAEKDALLAEKDIQLAEFEVAREVLVKAKEAGIDFKSIVEVLQRRLFNTNSDAMRFLEGALDIDDRHLREMGYQGLLEQIDKETDGVLGEPVHGNKETKEDKTSDTLNLPDIPKDREQKNPRKQKGRFTFTAPLLQKFDIDSSNLPEGSKLIIRKGKADAWVASLLFVRPAMVLRKDFVIGRFNMPGSDPQNSLYPATIVPKNPLMPSFARFYLETKIAHNVSENQILDLLKTMKAQVPQSSLNKWMHQIMACLRTRLEGLMLECVRQSKYTQNDETRFLVRSYNEEEKSFEYNIEYIHAALSLEKKLVVMLYEEGSRAHDIQEEKLFKDSCIRYFTADRAPLYSTIVNDINKNVDYVLSRSGCWFHARHYMVDAYITDNRVLPLIKLMNALFLVERVSKDLNHSWQARQAFRQKYSKPIVDKIFRMLNQIRLDQDKYGAMVMRAVNYILDDEQAFRCYLENGMIECSNNNIERCFRHIAMGRRNWMHIGSHEAASNIAFMFSLYESCKMNGIDFGEYVEDILTRIVRGEEDFSALLPNTYQKQKKEGAMQSA